MTREMDSGSMQSLKFPGIHQKVNYIITSLQGCRQGVLRGTKIFMRPPSYILKVSEGSAKAAAYLCALVKPYFYRFGG